MRRMVRKTVCVIDWLSTRVSLSFVNAVKLFGLMVWFAPSTYDTFNVTSLAMQRTTAEPFLLVFVCVYVCICQYVCRIRRSYRPSVSVKCVRWQH